MTPEEKARVSIDAQLGAAGWLVQDYRDLDLSAGPGLAVREFPLSTGEADYMLYAGGKAIGVVEAKPEGHTLTGVEVQSGKYLDALPDDLPTYRRPLPFAYESTGTETQFTNTLEADARSRSVYAFHRPDELIRLANLDQQVRTRLKSMPPLVPGRLWRVQIETINKLERSLSDNRPRSLIQMATGSGKTFTAVNFCYRLIKHAGAKRILFLVDRKNLGEQTLNEFQQFASPTSGYKFTEEYVVQHLRRNTIDPAAKVVITTIQRLYSMLKGDDEFDEGNEESSMFETGPTSREPVPLEYNPAIPIETFDVIVVDECHRSIYNLWRPVLEYFDASLIGLTATPSAQTIGFFGGNLVQDYSHERAVMDNVNVGFEVYRIETQVTASGVTLARQPGIFVPHRDRRTHDKKYRELDADQTFTANQLDRDVVVNDQIRLVIQTFRDKLPEIFPGRTEVPKTLVFAKTDLHAEDVVKIIREEFGRGNDFCQKITAKSHNPRELLQQLRNQYNPRIAVTVDMIATGTDVKPLECLLFLRNIKSLAYYQQMVGRGCRVIDKDALLSVTPDAHAKTHFVIVDAVGVCEDDKIPSKPLDRQPSVPLDKLLKTVSTGIVNEDVVSTLAARLSRLGREVNPVTAQLIQQAAEGKPLEALAAELLASIDPDAVVEAASRRFSPTNYPEVGYFDPKAPISVLDGNLPHWRQEGATYFVTFRLADSLPQSKLQQWVTERDEWLARHPEPHSVEVKQEYCRLFTDRIHKWLDQGLGDCLLAQPDVRRIVADAILHFQGERYELRSWVVMPNHVHALVTPMAGHELSDIMHSWKSFSAKQINALVGRSGPFWQKESFDHIVRSPEALERIEAYICANPIGLAENTFTLSPDGKTTRQDAASTWEPTEQQYDQVERERMQSAVKPFLKPALRNAILQAKQEANVQVIDEQTRDTLTRAGFDAAALDKARKLITDFRQFIDANKDEIEALQILYSKPAKLGLRFAQVKELAAKLKSAPSRLDPARLWLAYEATEPAKVQGRGGHKVADVVALVRHAIDPDTVLTPVANAVEERYQSWLADRAAAGLAFTTEQRHWLDAIRDHIAASLSIDRDDLDDVPFNQIGGLGRAHELFGDKLTTILDELNARLAA